MSYDYYRVRVELSPCTADTTDLIAAFLAEVGFESFEPDDTGLSAYISCDALDQAGTDVCRLTRETLADMPMPLRELHVESERIPGCDWNEEWEKHYFKPIVIEGRCVVHSSFHHDVPQAEFDIVIDPKMAFGTGHHHTTSRMASWILEEEMSGRSVIDMGTGTGILAILAAMRGATPVTGIEIDPGAYENALENVRLNHQDIRMICGDASALDQLEPADLLLANINRNIILGDIDRYAAALRPGGTMLLSGFYEQDIPVIAEAAERYSLTMCGKKDSDNWVAVKFRKAQNKF